MLVADKTNSLEVDEIISAASRSSAHKFSDTDSSDEKRSLVCLNSSDSSVLYSSNEDEYCMLSNPQHFKKGLAQWVLRFRVKHDATDDLLKLLRQHGFSILPKAARTLVDTPATLTLTETFGMQAHEFGFKKIFLKVLHLWYGKCSNACPAELELSLNVDGLPLFNSSNACFCVVSCLVSCLNLVFPVLICYGSKKPSNFNFFDCVVNELHDLILNGLKWNDLTILCRLKSVVCDAPARALVKSTKLCSGYFGCDKCELKGTYYDHKIVYLSSEVAPLRTDTSFRGQTNADHHKEAVSPFCGLPIDMVKVFPIDYMHQQCLGVMRKLIQMWVGGPRSVRISSHQIGQINEKLLHLRACIPSCFARKPRPISDIQHWKATELRQFLLYTGKVVMNNILSVEMYQNFLKLSVAMCILVSPELTKTHVTYANSLLSEFVVEMETIYGRSIMTYNVHSLLHIAGDAEYFNGLDNCSGFPFENYLQRLKNLVRSGNLPLAQVVKRLSEEDLHMPEFEIPATEKFIISTKHPDNAYIVRNNCVQVIKPNDLQNNEYVCKEFRNNDSMLVHPCDSKLIGVFKAKVNSFGFRIIKKSSLQCKAMCITAGNEIAFLSILHSI